MMGTQWVLKCLLGCIALSGIVVEKISGQNQGKNEKDKFKPDEEKEMTPNRVRRRGQQDVLRG